MAYGLSTVSILMTMNDHNTPSQPIYFSEACCVIAKKRPILSAAKKLPQFVQIMHKFAG